MSFFTSVAEIDRMLADLPPFDGATHSKVAVRKSQLTKPQGSFGKLEDIAIWMAGNGQNNQRSDMGNVVYLLAIMVLWRDRYRHFRQK